jgi:hypothetical protein
MRVKYHVRAHLANPEYSSRASECAGRTERLKPAADAWRNRFRWGTLSNLVSRVHRGAPIRHLGSFHRDRGRAEIAEHARRSSRCLRAHNRRMPCTLGSSPATSGRQVFPFVTSSCQRSSVAYRCPVTSRSNVSGKYSRGQQGPPSPARIACGRQ